MVSAGIYSLGFFVASHNAQAGQVAVYWRLAFPISFPEDSQRIGCDA
jgi:hypothetical protein